MLTVLHGHTSPETAYVVEDYPYGFRLRCKMRYWLEKADKGAKKGQYRLMTQTTNPKVAGEVWNKPKASTYLAFAVLTKNEANGHIHWDGLHECFWVNDWAKLVSRGIQKQFNNDEQTEVEALISARRRQDNSWVKFDALVADIRRCLMNFELDARSEVKGACEAMRYGNPIYQSDFDDAFNYVLAVDHGRYVEKVEKAPA